METLYLKMRMRSSDLFPGSLGDIAPLLQLQP